MLAHSKDLFCSSLTKHESAIADSGTTNNFVTTKDTVVNANSDAPIIAVKVENGQHSHSS